MHGSQLHIMSLTSVTASFVAVAVLISIIILVVLYSMERNHRAILNKQDDLLQQYQLQFAQLETMNFTKNAMLSNELAHLSDSFSTFKTVYQETITRLGLQLVFNESQLLITTYKRIWSTL